MKHGRNDREDGRERAYAEVGEARSRLTMSVLSSEGFGRKSTEAIHALDSRFGLECSQTCASTASAIRDKRAVKERWRRLDGMNWN